MIRLAAVLGAAALALRLGAAIATEHWPVFPAYYYADAGKVHEQARASDEARRLGMRLRHGGVLSQLVQAELQAALYRLTGPRALAGKVLNALFGTGAVVLLFFALFRLFDSRAAAAAAGAVALWPSHVFYTSQNFKEAPTALLSYAALAAALSLRDGKEGPLGGAILAMGLLLSLMAAGFFRSYVLLTLALSLGTGFLLETVKARSPKAFLGLAACAAASLCYGPAADQATRLLTGDPPQSVAAPRAASQLLPDTPDSFTPGVINRPTSPHGITGYRLTRQHVDRQKAKAEQGREIASQIYPDERFETWFDVLLFLPKGGFHVLFMPLPGLYPLEWKLGRWLAAMENVALVLLAALGAAGALRGPMNSGRAMLLVFLITMTGGAALLEFDLGSASRHKLLYLPMIFPFAAEELFRQSKIIRR